jgi:hypothetical protein
MDKKTLSAVFGLGFIIGTGFSAIALNSGWLNPAVRVTTETEAE